MSTAKRAMTIESRIRQTVDRTLTKYGMLDGVEHMIVGLSGGSDSMCLFDITLKIGEERGIVIHPVHVNHQLRKGVCDQEQKFCEDYCRSRGVECTSFVHDCQQYAKDLGISTEEAGRSLRYTDFAEIVTNSGIETDKWAIALAQNADDQVETVLMRILRGTGTDGLAGIPYVRMDWIGAKVIRPILDVSKEDTLGYCHELGLDYCTDETNGQDIYHRNKIRLNLIPYLEENYNPSLKDAVIRLAQVAQEEKALMDDLVNLALDDAWIGIGDQPHEVKLKVPVLRDLDPALAKKVVRRVLRDMGMLDISFSHYEACYDAIMGDNPSAEVHLPGGYYLVREYEEVVLGFDLAEADSDGSLEGFSNDDPGENGPKLGILLLSKEEFEQMSLETGKFAAFDMDSLREMGINSPEDLIVRSIKAGDQIRLKIGSKKLQDVMTDDKIPKRSRDQVQVAAFGNQVLYMVSSGRGKRRWAHGSGVSENTQKILLIVEKY